MSDADKRLDYFRSELEGKLNSYNKKLAEDIASLRSEIRQLRETVEKLTHEVKNVEMSLR